MLQLLLQDPLLLLANKQYPSMTKFIHWRNPYKLQHASYSETSFYQRNLPIQLPKWFYKNGVNYLLTRIATSGPLEKQTKNLQNRIIWDKPLNLGISVSTNSFILERSPFKESCLMAPECWTKLMNFSKFLDA